jgi:hypothetical protein
MVPSSKVEPFKQAKINKKLSKPILHKFLYDLHHDIYESLWKIHAVKWKAWKKDHQITKRSFSREKNKNDTMNNIPRQQKIRVYAFTIQ